MRIRQTLLLVALAAYSVLAVAPATAWSQVLAFTEGETEGEEEVVEDQGSELGIVPAVEAPPEVPETTDAPWTERFLAPTVLALGVLGIAGSVLYYGARVRGRYKVVR